MPPAQQRSEQRAARRCGGGEEKPCCWCLASRAGVSLHSWLRLRLLCRRRLLLPLLLLVKRTRAGLCGCKHPWVAAAAEDSLLAPALIQLTLPASSPRARHPTTHTCPAGNLANTLCIVLLLAMQEATGDTVTEKQARAVPLPLFAAPACAPSRPLLPAAPDGRPALCLYSPLLGSCPHPARMAGQHHVARAVCRWHRPLPRHCGLSLDAAAGDRGSFCKSALLAMPPHIRH